MLKHKFTLLGGIEYEGKLHADVVMRPAMASDAYAAVSSIEPPEDLATNEGARLAYQMQVDDFLLLMQVEQIGELVPAPAPEVLMPLLLDMDIEVIRAAGIDLKKKLIELRLSSQTSAP